MSRYIDYYPCHPFLSIGTTCEAAAGNDPRCGQCGCAKQCFSGTEYSIPVSNPVYHGGAIYDQQQYDSYSKKPACCCEGIMAKPTYEMQRWGVKECNRFGTAQYVTNANLGAVRPDARGCPRCVQTKKCQAPPDNVRRSCH